MTTEEQRPQDSTPEESNVPAAQPTAADVATPEAIEGAPPVTAPEPVITPTPVVEQSASTPSVAEILAAANAAPAPVSTPIAEPTIAEPTTAALEAERSAEETASDRIRHKLGVTIDEKPHGSEDIKSQRPETPTNTTAVEIPEADDLDADLDAEISQALSAVEVPSFMEPPQHEDSGDDVAAVTTSADAEEVGPGSKVTGVVQHVHGDDIFLNAGLLHDVIISSKQFAVGKIPEVGASVTCIIELVDEDGLFRARLPEARSKSSGGWDGLAVGQIVDCMVSAVNKGGLQVKINNLQGFLPASQVDLGFVAELEQYVGQTLSVQITEVKPKKRNLVVSRRALLMAERESTQGDFLKTLEVGQDYTGTVKTLKSYGAFVNLGPIDGFLHVGEISWSRINHPNEVLKEGQQVQVRILKFDEDKSRISLGMKQMMQNPWQGLSDRYPQDSVVAGKVTRTAEFGAFVELETGVEGLVHISELAWKRVGSTGEVLKVGEVKDFKVLEVDQKRKRVSLSLKALEQKPESLRKAEVEEDLPARKPNLNLKGGMGGNAPGGLFGNPTDFTS
jgi:small subunit ribosomal protein S1